jgi:uncharacterized protein (TIGR02246 family)
MAAENSKRRDEAQIRELIDRWLKALRTKDLDGIMSCYSPDVLLFDLLPPLRYVGADAYRKNWAEWFATFDGPVGYEIRDLTLTTDDNVAFSHSVNRVSGKRTDGKDSDAWVRSTVCYRKADGKWMVADEHVPVPYYIESGKAAVDLKPW